MNAPKLLPADPIRAVRHITGIVEQLLKLMERESMALATGDGVSFTAVQTEKAVLSESYKVCAGEFKARLIEFRAVDKSLLDRLDALQRELAARSQENMAAMERLGGGVPAN